MPEKPIVTSKANPHYQKRFDYLAERAAAADWPAVEAYEVKGINSYATRSSPIITLAITAKIW